MIKDIFRIFRESVEPICKVFRTYVVRALEAPNKNYTRLIFNNMTRLYANIRKGDIVLVEGRSEMARIINVITQSPWSHAAFYAGDALIQSDSPKKDEYLARFGDEAAHLIIEAYAGEKVHAVPISRYKDFNIRICRPYGLMENDLKKVVADVASNIGKEYDDLNVLDLALLRLIPFRRKTAKACLGSCSEFQVICSGMIARAFQRVGYPIIPSLATPTPVSEYESPYGSRLIMRHYSQILPRDFDLSPNFDIIKFNIIESGAFDYKDLWQEGEFREEELDIIPISERMDLVKLDDITLDRSVIDPKTDSIVVWITKLLFRK